MKTPEERIVELEATIGYLLHFLEPLADAVMMTHRRLLALEGVLEVKRVVTDEEIAAKIEAIDDLATLEMEYGPDYVEFRRLREFLKRQAEDKETDQGT